MGYRTLRQSYGFANQLTRKAEFETVTVA